MLFENLKSENLWCDLGFSKMEHLILHMSKWHCMAFSKFLLLFTTFFFFPSQNYLLILTQYCKLFHLVLVKTSSRWSSCAGVRGQETGDAARAVWGRNRGQRWEWLSRGTAASGHHPCCRCINSANGISQPLREQVGGKPGVQKAPGEELRGERERVNWNNQNKPLKYSLVTVKPH